MRPLDTFAYTKEVSCLLQTGQVHEAEHVLRELRTVDPQSQEASMGLALMAVARGQADESRSYFTEVLARDARRADARQFLALLDGSLAEPSRAELCGIVRSLAVAAAADAHPAGPAVCP
jgi:Flp pilus assembly protein TadD